MKTGLLKFIIAMVIFLNAMTTKGQCSNASRTLRNHQDGIMELLLSTGDTNIYTEVLECDYNWWNDRTEISHYISFNGFWTGTSYEAIGKLVIKDGESTWYYLKGNNSMNEYLVQMGLMAVLAYAADQ